jgi:Zn-dependent protease with chaperone function
MEPILPAKRRLNLFAFSPETDTLFALLLVAAMMLAAQLSYLIRYLFFPNSGPNLDNLDTAAMLRGEVLAETLTTLMLQLGIPAVLVGLIFGVALFIYWGHPRRVRRRKKLQPLLEKDMPLQQAVHTLVTAAGVSPLPTVEMPRGYQGTSGQAFGLQGNYIICLDGGLRVWQRLKPGWFGAIVLHELAHIANGDIWRSYFAEALWTAIVTLSIAPLVLGVCNIIAQGLFTGLLRNGAIGYLEVLGNALPLALGLFFQAGVTVMVVAAIRARLLRIREVYADWRATLWGGEDSLREIFQESAEREKKTSGFGLWRLHPTAAERLLALNQPSRLFQLSWELPFVVGFLLAFVLGGVLLLAPPFYLFVLEPIRVARVELGNWYQANPHLLVSLLFWVVRGVWFLMFFAGIIIVFAPIAWLVSGVLGAQLQKQTAADLTAGRWGLMEYPKLGAPAVLLTLGMEVGFWTAPFNFFVPKSLAGLVVEIIMLGILTTLAWLFLAYARFITMRLFAAYTGATPPAWQTRLSRWALNGWLFICFIPGLVFNRFLIWNVSDPDWFQFLLVAFVMWLVGVVVFSSIIIAISWGAVKLLSVLRRPRCPACGRVTRRAIPAIELCEHCEHNLGEWLFVPEGKKLTHTMN